MFAAIHCNYCPSIWPPPWVKQQLRGPSMMMHTVPYKARRWKLLIFASKQCNWFLWNRVQNCNAWIQRSLSPRYSLKMAMHKLMEILLQSIKLVLLQTDWIKAQESTPNLQYNNRDKKSGKMLQTFSVQGLARSIKKANVSLTKLSKIVKICRSSSSCYLLWEISGIRTKFSHSKNET